MAPNKSRIKREDANNNHLRVPAGEISRLMVSLGQKIDERFAVEFAEVHGKIGKNDNHLHARVDEISQRVENQGQSGDEDSDRRESGSEDEGGEGDENEEDDGVEREDNEEDITSPRP